MFDGDNLVDWVEDAPMLAFPGACHMSAVANDKVLLFLGGRLNASSISRRVQLGCAPELPPALIETQLEGVPCRSPGPLPFEVVVTVAKNELTTPPLGANLRVYFDSTLVSGPTITPSLDMPDAAFVGPLQGLAPNNYVKAGVIGSANTNPTPELFRLHFTRLQTGEIINITVAPGPDREKNLPFLTTRSLPEYPYFEIVEGEIPHLFDSRMIWGLAIFAGVDDWRFY